MDKLSIQEALVSNFASLLGAKAQGLQTTSSGITTITGVTSSSSDDDFSECLSDAIDFADIVCTLPSMVMRIDSKAKDSLPGVGSHFEKPADRPEMAASVLNASDNSENASSVEKAAAKTLGNITSWTKSTLAYASQAATKSISSSFSSLVSSRVRAWTLLLLRHSLTTGDAASRTRLLSMLSSNIEIKSTETNFKTLSLPDEARSHPKEADVILPLLFEAKLQVSIQGKDDSVFLRAPGTISGHFARGDQPGLKKVDIRLDTNALFESMVEQARLVVFKAVARATSASVRPSTPASPGSSNDTSKPVVSDQRALSSFSSALKLTPDALAKSPRLEKARSSALRLNSILQGKTAPSGLPANPSIADKVRKNRSVQFDAALDIHKSASSIPPHKRQRIVQSQARLRSFKSFGRPHGGQGGAEARNATFGDFGRGPPVWGRDGKLLNHPTPGLASSALSSLAEEPSQKSIQNATFDLSNPPKTMKRTATALESWLMNTATSR